MSESFAPLWGDLVEKVGKKSSAETTEPKSTVKVVGDPKVIDKTLESTTKAEDPVVVENKGGAEVTPSTKSEKGDGKPGEEGGKVNKVDKNEEEYEFTDEDFSKAYTMLLDEGVLDVAEDEEFENSSKGVADAVAFTVRRKVDKALNSAPPVVKRLYEYLSNKDNSIEDFNLQEQPKWAEFSVDTDDDRRAVLKQFHLSQGLSEEEAEEEVEDAENALKLDKKAATALAVLVKNESDIEAKNAALNAKNKEKADKKLEDEINAIKKNIDDTEELAGFKLDDKTKTDFKDYIFKEDKRTGKTQMQLNMVDEKRRLRIAFLDFMDFSKDDIEKNIKSKLTKIRAKKLSNYSDSNVKSTNSSRPIKTQKERKGKLVIPSIFGNTDIEVED